MKAKKKKPAKLYAHVRSGVDAALKARQRKRPRLPFPKDWKAWRLVEAGEPLQADDLVWPISRKAPVGILPGMVGEPVSGDSAYLQHGFYYRRTK